MLALIFALVAGLFLLYSEVGAQHYIMSDAAKDVFIQSENYPKSYNQLTNITWEWNVTVGQWGVMFLDFDLDDGSNSIDGYDSLKIDDRKRNIVIYTSRVRPALSYISVGPQLLIQFVSDSVSESHKRGFKLRVLHGANQRDVDIKLHEAKEQEKEESDAGTLLIILTATVAVLALVISLVVVILILRSKRAKTGSENRNIFGVRRNSGISHSRKSSPSNEQQQQQRRIERPVQRSASQLDWMARAELSTNNQKSGCTPRTNACRCSDRLTNADGVSSKLSATTSRKTANSYGHSNFMRVNHAMRSYESSLNEYSDTVDSLCCRQGDDGDLNPELPSYEESLSPMASRCSADRVTHNAATCYQNAWPGQLLHENQTNIYINTGSSSTDNNGSIQEITIGASKCIIKSTCSDSLKTIDKSSTNMDSHEGSMTVYQNCSVNGGKNCKTTSTSSVKIIDGYAFIVPSSTKRGESSQSMSPSREQTILTVDDRSQQNIQCGNSEASFISTNQEGTQTSTNIYFNDQCGEE